MRQLNAGPRLGVQSDSRGRYNSHRSPDRHRQYRRVLVLLLSRSSSQPSLPQVELMPHHLRTAVPRHDRDCEEHLHHPRRSHDRILH